MQIVIDIPDRIHYGIEKGITVNGSEASQILIDAVKNGTPLPKGHGDLVDRNDLLEYTDINISAYTPTINRYDIITMPTIIEAERSEEDADTN